MHMKLTKGSKLFENKKVLLVGLGSLGGGLAMAKFLLKEGARLTITDLKTAHELKESIARLPRGKVKLVLGKHRKEDFIKNDSIVCNQATSIHSPWLAIARKHNKRIESDLTLYLSILKKRDIPYCALTGTRGKTTTTNWLAHFIGGDTIVGGNMPQKGLLGIVYKKTKLFVLELSSFQLEYIKRGCVAPKVACITNLSVDHLNRHKTFAEYARVKARIFLNQTESDFLVLNADDRNTKFFLKQKPKSKIYFTSLRVLPKTKNGLYSVNNTIYFQEAGKRARITRVEGLGDHEKRNLLMAMLGAHLYGVSWKNILLRTHSLPQIPLRQEVIVKKRVLTVINDSAGTSPEATIAALQKFSKQPRLVLITGGTDKQLEFKDLAKRITRTLQEENLFLLEGSATNKLIIELQKQRFFKKEPQLFENLESIVTCVSKTLFTNPSSLTTILFSPASASFEKFKNEFDRGTKFTALAKKYL